MAKQEDVLRNKAIDLENWLAANVGHPDYEVRNREHNIILSKIKAREDRIKRRRNPDAGAYQGLSESHIPIKYQI